MEVDPSKLDVAPDPSQVGTLKYPLLTHDRVDTRPTRNIKMKQYLCVKHALPKTRLTNTILYENVSHGRHLEMKVSSIAHRRGRTLNTMDITRRAFVAQQERKKRKWKREDEVRLSGMNLPSMSPVDRKDSVDVVYHSSDNESRSRSGSLERKPILPMMKFRKERTEIVFHEDRSFITKLPAYVEVNEAIQTVFDAYRGKAYLSRDLPSRDERFRRLETMLQPPLGTESNTPTTSSENFTCKSRKKAGELDPSQSFPTAQQMAESRVMIASRGRSRDANRGGHAAVDYITDCRKSAANSSLRRAEILHSFKTQDLNELAKSLTRESHIDLNDLRQGQEGASTGNASHRRSSNIPSACARSRPQHHVPSLGLQFEMKES